MKNKQDKSRSKMYSYYQRWEVSGMSIQSFAKLQGIPSSTFTTGARSFLIKVLKGIKL